MTTQTPDAVRKATQKKIDRAALKLREAVRLLNEAYSENPSELSGCRKAALSIVDDMQELRGFSTVSLPTRVIGKGVQW